MARPVTYDQEKVKELRMAVVYACIDVLSDSPKVKKWSAYKKEMILRMSPRVLPTIAEHSGPDGKPIPIMNVLPENNSNTEDNETE